jgi:hypothetical protein
MAAALLLTRPGLLRGAILFRPLSPFVNNLPTRLDNTPVLILDGEKDSRRSPGDGVRLAKRLTRAGATVSHHVLPVGHSITSMDQEIAREWLWGSWAERSMGTVVPKRSWNRLGDDSGSFLRGKIRHQSGGGEIVASVGPSDPLSGDDAVWTQGEMETCGKLFQIVADLAPFHLVRGEHHVHPGGRQIDHLLLIRLGCPDPKRSPRRLHNGGICEPIAGIRRALDRDHAHQDAPLADVGAKFCFVAAQKPYCGEYTIPPRKEQIAADAS